jgi:hypothetical protein
VDSSSGRSISVQSTDDNMALRVIVDQDRMGGHGADQDVSVGRQADRQALGALLPHDRVEFVAAGADGGLR